MILIHGHITLFLKVNRTNNVSPTQCKAKCRIYNIQSTFPRCAKAVGYLYTTKQLPKEEKRNNSWLYEF